MTPGSTPGVAQPGSIGIGHLSSGGDAAVLLGNLTHIVHQASAPSIKSLHQLRAPVSDFVGRQDEIDQLVQTLSEATKGGAAAITGMRGLGGIGKTELAYAVAQRLVDIFPDAQLLLEMRGTSNNPLRPEQALRTVIRAFEPLAQVPNDVEGLRSAYVSLLSGKRVLVLADDARDARQVEPLRPPAGCALLLTSRQRFNLPGMEPFDLGVLSQTEAEQLLLEIYPAIGSSAPRMAQLCGRLPLALRLSAGTCSNSSMSIEYHLRALEDERERLAHLRDPDDPNVSIEASFELSYTALELEAQQVLCQLGVFPTSFDMTAAKAVVQVAGATGQSTTAKHRPIEALLDILYRRSLVEWDNQTERYSLHDLVRSFALARLGGDSAVRLRHAQYYVQVAAIAEELFLKGGESLLMGLKMFDQERANIDAGWNWAREQAAKASGSTSQDIDELLVHFAGATANVGSLRYDIRQERIPQLLAALEAAQRSGPRAAEGHCLGNLGSAYAALGETHKAIQYYEQDLIIAREIGDRRGEGHTLGNLGVTYRYIGETHKAIQYHKQNLIIAREIGDRRSEGNALGNLGNVYRHIGETHKAIQYHEQVLIIAREIGDRQGESISSWNLGALLAKEGGLARAVELMQVTVDYEREVGHADAERDAAELETLRKRLAGE